MNDSVSAMYKKPGKYFVTARQSRLGFVAEVDVDGNCHQLTPKLERDGILSPDRWNLSAICTPITADELSTLLEPRIS